ncbi:hypothetical protein SLEP1_g43172 [Rubroshorea leprosula]|uniref:Uncharacterized protein n=1 Tax=Rubroshorea leprosula TaxID=152421 RepID=A0AAV5LCN9_9ROSI|nr:hypothetical protein SLEP1_g43172 [Rubroshorea leprosula]
MGFSMQPYGIQDMLTEGHKHLSGLEEAILKNIDACKELSAITHTSLGPNDTSFPKGSVIFLVISLNSGTNKMVINHLDKLFVTNDAATIVNELEVQRPAAKILVLAGKAQQQEIGDGANLTISFAGELLQNAEELIRTGLHPSEIISGYTKVINKTVEILGELVEKGSESMDVRVKEQVITRMKAAVASKQFGQDVAVFVTGVDTSATETKGTVLIHSAEQLQNYAKTEEAKVEELIKAVADSGAKIIVSGEAVGEMALHFSQTQSLNCDNFATQLVLLLFQPKPDDLGYVDSVSVEKIGGVQVTILRVNKVETEFLLWFFKELLIVY